MQTREWPDKEMKKNFWQKVVGYGQSAIRTSRIFTVEREPRWTTVQAAMRVRLVVSQMGNTDKGQDNKVIKIHNWIST